jgi:protoporphyrinogen oxidase
MPRLPGIRLHQALRVPRLERLLARFAPHLSPHEPERGGPHDDRSIADFARLYFGSSVLERWLEPFLSDTLVCEPEESSRVFLLMQLAARHGCFRGNLRGDLDRIAQGLSPESGVRLGEEVIGLEPAGQRQLRVHHRGEAGESATEAEAVVLALPAAQVLDLAPDLLAGAEKDFFAATRYVSVASLAVGLDRPAARHATRVRVPAAEGWPITALALEPGVPGGRIPEGRGLALLLGRDAFARAHEDASDESIAAALLPYLERLYPATRSGISWTRVTRYPRALPRFDVGRYRALARLRRVEKDRRARGRRLYFAGDHLVAPTLEGAVVSGLRAAKAVAEDLGGAD